MKPSKFPFYNLLDFISDFETDSHMNIGSRAESQHSSNRDEFDDAAEVEPLVIQKSQSADITNEVVLRKGGLIPVVTSPSQVILGESAPVQLLDIPFIPTSPSPPPLPPRQRTTPPTLSGRSRRDVERINYNIYHTLGKKNLH